MGSLLLLPLNVAQSRRLQCSTHRLFLCDKPSYHHEGFPLWDKLLLPAQLLYVWDDLNTPTGVFSLWESWFLQAFVCRAGLALYTASSTYGKSIMPSKASLCPLWHWGKLRFLNLFETSANMNKLYRVKYKDHWIGSQSPWVTFLFSFVTESFWVLVSSPVKLR